MTDERRPAGRVVPFTQSAAYLRRRGAEHARRGRLIEAAELTRLSWQQDGRPETLFALAERLHDMGCDAQAARLLYQLCAEKDVPRGVYYLLGVTLKAQGDRDGAIDALYHDLAQDPDSVQSDDARELLGELTLVAGAEETFRMPVLLRQGLNDVAAQKQEQGLRKLDRALNLAADPQPVRVTLALLDLALGRTEEGIRHAAGALRNDQRSLRAWSALCMLLAQAGRRRAARGLLHALPRDGENSTEDVMIAATGTSLGDADFVRAYLERRLRQRPCAVHLLHGLADVLWETGERERARALWERISRIDPEDIRAYALRKWSEHEPTEPLPPEGKLPREQLMALLGELAEALARDVTAEELFARGGRLRMLLDWAFTVPDGKLQGLLVRYVSGQEGDAATQALRRMLVSPDVLPKAKETSVMCLAERGETGPHAMLMGGRLVEASCKAPEQGQARRWNTFLRLLLAETRAYRESTQVAFFAANAWAHMTAAEKRSATGERSYAYVKAVELMYLLKEHESGRMETCVRDMAISPRRVERVMRLLSRRMDLPLWQDEGEKE